MSNFEWWFLLVYTVYTVVSILALMWVAGEEGKAERIQPSRVQK